MSLFIADYGALSGAIRTLAKGSTAMHDHAADAGGSYDALHMGRVAEAWDAAEAAVFNALNMAAVYLDDGDAADAMVAATGPILLPAEN